MIAQLRNAWMMENLQTAMRAQGCNSWISSSFFHQFVQTDVQLHLLMMNNTKDSTKRDEFLMNKGKKKCEEKLRKLREFVNFVI